MNNKKFLFECWNVAFRKHKDLFQPNDERFVIIKNPLFYWAADPFITFSNGKYYIFAELYNRITRKGQIRYCVINNNGKKVSKWKKALRAKKHLSFPFIYKKGDDFFLMPESSKMKHLSVYKSKKFPNKWILENELIENDMVADSVFIDENTIYTYDNYSRPRKAILYKNINNTWKKVFEKEDPDVILRPAGKVFLHNEKHIIPLQDSHGGEYGENLYFAEIVCDYVSFKITKILDFNKKLIGQTIDGKEIKGVHTYNFINNFEVIDAKTYSRNLLSFIGYTFFKICKIIKINRGGN